MAERTEADMIKLLNGGDKRELRAFLTLYAKPIHDRAFIITKDELEAKRVTRRVISEIVLLAAKGKLEENVDAQLMSLTDACCSEDLFLVRLVDDTMEELDEAAEHDRYYDAVSRARVASDRMELWRTLLPERRVRVSAPEAAPAPEPEPPAYKEPEPSAYRKFLMEEQAAPTAATSAPAGYAPIATEPLMPEEDVLELFDDEEDDVPNRKSSPMVVVLIILLSIITLALVWVLVVKLMYIGLLPMSDLGFGEWFNKNLFMLY